jgi:hypothetical protein
MRRISRRWVAIGLVAGVLVLAGCGTASERAGEELAEQLLEAAAEDSGLEDVEIETDEEGSLSITFEGEEGEGEISLSGDLPDDFPLPLPDDYTVASSFKVDQGAGVAYSAVVTLATDDRDAVSAMYEDFLRDEGFEVSTNVLTSGEEVLVFISGERDDVRVDISITAEGDDVTLSLSWTPEG